MATGVVRFVGEAMPRILCAIFKIMAYSFCAGFCVIPYLFDAVFGMVNAAIPVLLRSFFNMFRRKAKVNAVTGKHKRECHDG